MWPITVGQDEQAEQYIRRFFIINMKAPAALAKDVEIKAVKKAISSHARSRIHDEYIITFKEVEARDVLRSYANGLASRGGELGCGWS